MKKISIIAIAMAVFAAVSCTEGVQVSKKTQALAPTAAQADSVSYLVGVQFGSIIKGNNFGDLSLARINAGIKDFLNCEKTPRDKDFAKEFKIDPQLMQQVISDYMNKRTAYIQAANKEKEILFFAEKANEETVDTTESGIYYVIENPGTEEKIGEKDQLYLHYTGTLPDGKVFDSVPAEDPSANFTLERVIAGWKEGLQLIGDGGHIKLYIPSKLAYGEHGTYGIEPNTPLTFDVQIDSVKRYVETPEDAKETEKK